MFENWQICFPNFRGDTQEMTPEELTADYIASLEPTPFEDGNPDNHAYCSDGNEPEDVLAQTSIDDVLQNWFFEDQQAVPNVDYNCVLNWIFSDSGSHCEALRDATVTVMQEANLNYDTIGPDVEDNRQWMSLYLVDAYK